MAVDSVGTALAACEDCTGSFKGHRATLHGEQPHRLAEEDELATLAHYTGNSGPGTLGGTD